MFKYVLAMLIGTFISSVSQVILKKAANVKYDNILKEYLNPRVIIAYFIFFLATLLSVLAYKGIPLSMGPVLEALAYLYITVFGVTIFNEKITIKKIIALCFIIAGIIIYSVCG